MGIRFYFILIIILIAGFSLGFLAQRQIPTKTQLPQKQESIPLPSEFLVNPVLQKLYANAEGTVVAKTGDSLTIEKEGKQLTMFIEEGSGLTGFAEETTYKLLKFTEIRLGDYLKGGITIIVASESAVGLSANRKVGDIIAQRFTVIRK